MMNLATEGATAAVGDVRIVLAAIAYLLIKQCVADFLLQTENQWRTKGDYGAVGGITHAATHVVLTLPVFFVLPPIGVGAVAALLIGEFAIHYHIDWAKEQAVRRYHWTSKDTSFWWALGVDQLTHGLTYVALVWLAFSLATGALSLPPAAL